MTQKNLLDQLADAEQEYQTAKNKLSKAKAALVAMETIVIEKKIKLDTLQQQVREMRDTTPGYVVVELREREIEEFRQRYPQLVEEARMRDLKDK
jgi:hypothetical protein